MEVEKIESVVEKTVVSEVADNVPVVEAAKTIHDAEEKDHHSTVEINKDETIIKSNETDKIIIDEPTIVTDQKDETGNIMEIDENSSGTVQNINQIDTVQMETQQNTISICEEKPAETVSEGNTNSELQTNAKTTTLCESNTNKNSSESVSNPTTTTTASVKNTSLGLLSQYISSEDSSSDSGDSDESNDEANDELQSTDKRAEEILALEKIQQHIASGPYRIASGSSSSSSSSSELESAESDSSDVEEIIVKTEPVEIPDDEDDDGKVPNKGPIKSIGEIGIADLPPIEDLKITVPEEECVELGKIMSVVDQLVLVDSIPGTVPVNLETVLFLDKGRSVLGQVFDVLGNISSPIYCVRFNTNQEIKERNILIGTIVYVAPRTEHTSFVILSELMKDRGTDASRENDNENSSDSEYSDDEKERRAKATKLGKQKFQSSTSNVGDGQSGHRGAHSKRGRGAGGNRRPPRGGYQNNNNNNNRRNDGNYRYQNQSSQQYPSNNAHHSWHSNFPNGSNQMMPGPFYPNPYAQNYPYYNMQPPGFPGPNYQMYPPQPPQPPPNN